MREWVQGLKKIFIFIIYTVVSLALSILAFSINCAVLMVTSTIPSVLLLKLPAHLLEILVYTPVINQFVDFIITVISLLPSIAVSALLCLGINYVLGKISRELRVVNYVYSAVIFILTIFFDFGVLGSLSVAFFSVMLSYTAPKK